MRSVLGGGTTPGFEIASAGWVVSGSGQDIEANLRSQDPPVVGRIEAGCFLLDFRTVLEGQERLVSLALEQLVEGERAGS
jgi:seryl-tRNA(Sec) selenium transferase